MEKERWVIRLLITMAGYISYLLGGWDHTIGAMFIFIVSDYATGYIRSCLKGKLSSKAGYQGILKKCSYIFVVLIGAALDRVVLENNLNIPITIFNFPVSFKVVLICSVIGTEGISIVENLAEMGIIIPSPVKRLFKQLQDKETIENTKDKN